MKAALLCFTDYKTEPRVLRTIEALKEFQIDVIDTISTDGRSVHVRDLNYDVLDARAKGWLQQKARVLMNKLKGRTLNSANYFEHKYWSKGRKLVLKKITEGNYSLVVGHGIYAVPILASLPKTTKKIFNAHEFYEREFEENKMWLTYSQPYYNYILKHYLHKLDLMLCVCNTIQNDYQHKYRINSIVQPNARKFEDLRPCEVSGKKIKLVHHGAAIRGRNLEKTINVINYLPDNFEIHLILVPSDPNYCAELKTKYATDKRIVFHEIVKMNELPGYLNQFDIGIYILPPTNYNNLAALPNKFFDFVQARLCIAVSPNIEMKQLTEKYELGVVSDDFESETLAKKIRNLSTADISRYKANSHKHAFELSDDQTRQAVANAVKQLFTPLN